jgi:hypothetical protein
VAGSLRIGPDFTFAATQGFTWCAWVRYDEQFDTSSTTMVYFRDATWDNRFILGGKRGLVQVRIENNGEDRRYSSQDHEGYYDVTKAIWPDPGQWAFMAVAVKPDGEIRIRLRGGLDGSLMQQPPNNEYLDNVAMVVSPPGVAVNPEPIVYSSSYIGAYDCCSEGFTGVFRDIRLYARALTDTELVQLWSAAPPPTPPPTPVPAPTTPPPTPVPAPTTPPPTPPPTPMVCEDARIAYLNAGCCNGQSG